MKSFGISSRSVVTAVTNQVFSNLGDEAVILHLGEGKYYGLNEVGAVIWNLVQKPSSVDEVVTEIVSKYQVSRRQCEADALKVLHRMADAGLIEVKSA